MSSAQESPLAAEEIARDASWLVQALDPSAGMVRLVAMDRDSYRGASFLDDRMMQQPVDAQVVPWPQVEAAISEDMRHDARWIFHIGHVGSTLISRLLGEINNVLAVREPRILRDLALSPAAVRDLYVAPIPELMSRTFAEEEIACVKATSFVSEIASELVRTGERALFMYAAPANYIASILAGENSLQELRFLAGSRAQRLAERMSPFRPVHNDADLAAIAWACEMSALEGAADAMADRSIEWADFDSMLDDVEGALGWTAAFFGFGADDAQLRAIAHGRLTSRYSKDVSYDYSAGLRRDLIAQAANVHRANIDGALAMLDGAAEKSPLLARALQRSRPET
jgi:hypothetical protein